MKRILAAVGVAMVFTSAFAADDAAEWSTAVATRASDGHRIVHRYRSKFGKSFDRAAYPHRVTIIWKYESGSGLPSTGVREAMDRFEDLLAPQVEQPSVGTLVLVSTGGGERDWIYYARSQEVFMARLNDALRGQPRFAIEIELGEDPAWMRYEEFRAGVQPSAK